METREYWYDERLLLIAEISTEDDSFDHEFGTKRVISHEVTKLDYIIYIDNIDHDITKCMENSSFHESFKDFVLNNYRGTIE